MGCLMMCLTAQLPADPAAGFDFHELNIPRGQASQSLAYARCLEIHVGFEWIGRDISWVINSPLFLGEGKVYASPFFFPLRIIFWVDSIAEALSSLGMALAV